MSTSAEYQKKTAAQYRFGLFEADSGSRELRKSGVRLRLQAQPFRVLLCLLERPGDLVTREELQQRLWGDDTIVDFDHSLGTALNKLREALRDSSDNPHFIETLARRGYRFIAPVMVNADAPSESFQSIAGAASLPGIATNLMPPPTSAEIPRASVPGRKSRWHALAWTQAATAVVIVAFLLGLSLRLADTPPPRITQITFSGRVSPGDPLFESFPGTATVESRIYFQEIENGRAVLAQVLIADGETDTFTLPDELAALSLGDISPDGSRLLLRSHLATPPEQALWIVSTIGGTLQRIPGLLAHDATCMPDGQDILCARGDDLYMASENGSDIRHFAALPDRAFWLRWSPDGSRLRLTLLNSETHTSALWKLSSDGSHAHLLLSRTQKKCEARFSQMRNRSCQNWGVMSQIRS